MMSGQLHDKVAIITGSTSGIGLGLAHILATHGAHIMLNGLGDANIINQACDDVKQAGATYAIKCDYHDADMRDALQIKDLITHTKQEFGHIDILINNAGMQYVAPIENFPDQQWQDIIAVNLSSSFYSIKHAIPIMREQDYGRIINIASVHGLIASVDKSAYVAAKHGVMGLTKTVALENATSHIRCNAICPGWVKTPLVEKQITARAQAQNISEEQATRDLLAQKQPSLQFTSIAHIGDAVMMLCGDAGLSMNGAQLTLDGGWTAQ